MTATIRFIALAGLLLAGGAHLTQTAEVELTRLESEIPAMMLRGDAAAIARLTADDFVSYDPQGREVTKADILARMAQTQAAMESLTHERIRVRVFGDVAVATAISVVKGRSQGQPVGGRFRYTRVWVKRGGSWVAVAAHSSAIAEP